MWHRAPVSTCLRLCMASPGRAGGGLRTEHTDSPSCPASPGWCRLAGCLEGCCGQKRRRAPRSGRRAGTAEHLASLASSCLAFVRVASCTCLDLPLCMASPRGRAAGGLCTDIADSPGCPATPGWCRSAGCRRGLCGGGRPQGRHDKLLPLVAVSPAPPRIAAQSGAPAAARLVVASSTLGVALWAEGRVARGFCAQ